MIFSKPHRSILGLSAALCLSAVAAAQDGTWITSAAGTYNWSDAGNWLNGIVADGAGHTANFTTAGLTGNVTVTLDTARTIGALVFDNPSNAFGWTVGGGNTLTLSSGGAGGPTVAVNNPQITAVIAAPIAGTQGLTTTGPGTLSLTGANSYSGGTNVANGTLAVNADAALGTGNVTGASLGTLNFTSTTTTTKSFAMGGGTLAVAAGQTVTLNGGSVSAAYLDGTGTFATDPTNGAKFVNVTTSPAVTVTANNVKDQFVHFTNNGTVTILVTVDLTTALPPFVVFNGFINQGSGSVNLGRPYTGSSLLNASNLQSYGTLDVNPAELHPDASFSATNLLTNVGTTPLGFNGGSRTFIGTPDTVFVFHVEEPPGPQQFSFVAGIDLNAKNAVVTGGLLVNNGYIEDSSNNYTGHGTVVADFGSLVKGAGYFQNTVVTQNGGKFQAGNSPGTAGFGQFVFGPGGVNNYLFDINDATGSAGGTTGWGLVDTVKQSIRGGSASPGDFTWTATPSAKLTVAIDTLLNSGDGDTAGPMADFDPTKPYSWLAARWAGAYTGPTDAAALDAATGFDTSGFLNPIDGTFGWSLDPAGQTLSLVYTPTGVPEPGTLALVGFAAAGMIGSAARRRRS
jgi:autotransporter-associated beta strand protein